MQPDTRHTGTHNPRIILWTIYYLPLPVNQSTSQPPALPRVHLFLLQIDLDASTLKFNINNAIFGSRPLPHFGKVFIIDFN